MSQISGPPEEPLRPAGPPLGGQPAQPVEPGQPVYGQPQYGHRAGSYTGTGGGTAVAEMAPDQQRLWAWVGHVSSLLTTLVLSGASLGTIPFGFVGPLVIFLALKDRGIFVRRQAAEALNFQILVAVVWLAVVALGGLFTLVTLGLGAVLVVPLAVGLGIAAVILQIIAAVKANQGIDYRYPLNWRLVK